MIRLPELQASLEEVNAVPDTAQATELEELTRSVPKLITLLPSVLPDRSDIRYNAAISEMIAGLTLRLDKVRPLAVSTSCTILRCAIVQVPLHRCKPNPGVHWFPSPLGCGISTPRRTKNSSGRLKSHRLCFRR